MTRFTFKASFLKSTFTALTADRWCVKRFGKNLVKGLLEVKRAQRYDKPDTAQRIAMQESSQVVGWVINSGSTETTPNNQ
jgi:hypothetical protein